MVSGLTKHTSAADADDIDEVRHAHQMVPHTPTVDVAALLAAAVAREFTAAAGRLAAAAALQFAQIRTQTDPGEEADQACRVAHAALDAAEAGARFAAREVTSYQLRAYQLRVAEDVS